MEVFLIQTEMRMPRIDMRRLEREFLQVLAEILTVNENYSSQPHSPIPKREGGPTSGDRLTRVSRYILSAYTSARYISSACS